MIKTDIEYSKQAAKAAKKYDAKTKERIKKEIEGLLKIPPDGDIKQLKGYDDVTYRLRVGKYRIIFFYTKNGNLRIDDIDSRGDIYK